MNNLQNSSNDSIVQAKSSMGYNPTPNILAPVLDLEKDDNGRASSKIHIRINDTSTSIKDEFNSRIEFRIKMKDLETIKLAVDSITVDKNEQYKFGKEEFVNFMSTHLNKGTEQEYEELFDNIDVTQSGTVDWDKLTSYLLLIMYESDDRVKALSIPNWKPIKQIQNSHRDSIRRIEFLKHLNRYISISKEGSVCLYDKNLHMSTHSKINTDSCKSKDLWITDFVLLQNVNKLVLAFTTKEIGIYELNTKLDFNCVYRIYDLKATPLCLDFWFDPANPNDSILIWGDTAGEVHTIHFNSSLIALFERPATNSSNIKSQQSPNDSCLNIGIDEIKDNYKNAMYISYKAHMGWVRQVKWARNLECVISCATTNKKSVCLGWFIKKSSHIRVNYSVPIRAYDKSSYFNIINGGVNGFDFDTKLNLIATANQNTLVTIFNPYVNEPNGILKGHSKVVLAVKFMPNRGQLISFSADKILRIWNVQLQICIQRIANIFPKGPDVEVMCSFDEFAGRFFISFRYTLFMMEIKPEIVDRVLTHTNTVISTKFNKYNNQIITLAQDGTLCIWLVENGQKVKTFNNLHPGFELTALEFDESGTRFYTAGSDGLIKIWDFNGHCYHILEANEGQNCEISQVLAIKRRILAMGWNKSITVFRDTTLREERVSPSEWKGRVEHEEDILCATIMKTQPMFLITGSFDGDIVIWNSVTEQPYKHLNARKRQIKTKNKLSNDSGKRRNSRLYSRRFSKFEGNELFDPDNDFSNAITCLRTLNNRTYGRDCNLISCGGNGWVRFWDIPTGKVGAEFTAHANVGSVIMEVDQDEKYLVTGDINGMVKIWNIADYCVNFSSKAISIISEPPLISTIKSHSDQINSMDFCYKSGKTYLLIASSDCSVSLNDVKGNPIGIFGQDTYWKLDPSVSIRGTPNKLFSTSLNGMDIQNKANLTIPSIEINPSNDSSREQESKSLNLNSLNDDLADIKLEPTEFESRLILPALNKTFDVGNTYNYEPDAFVKNVNLRYNPWSKTILGKVYQESRSKKRERRQPGLIQSEEYIKWDTTGQAPGGLYGSLRIEDVEIKNDEKKSDTRKKIGPVDKETEKVSEPVFDEKTLFPKYLLDYEARVRQEQRNILAKMGKEPPMDASFKINKKRTSVASLSNIY